MSKRQFNCAGCGTALTEKNTGIYELVLEVKKGFPELSIIPDTKLNHFKIKFELCSSCLSLTDMLLMNMYPGMFTFDFHAQKKGTSNAKRET